MLLSNTLGGAGVYFMQTFRFVAVSCDDELFVLSPPYVIMFVDNKECVETERSVHSLSVVLLLNAVARCRKSD